MNNDKRKDTKKEIVEAALLLFYANGYDGTSIRDIAHLAKTNSANISYYFKNKNGLLEHCFITYLEGYTFILEDEVRLMEMHGAKACLRAVISRLLHFQGDNFRAARFIMREMSLESTLNREVLSTYLAKEKYFMQHILEYGMTNKEFRKVSPSACILQLKGLLAAPVLYGHYAAELLQVISHEKFYVEQYSQQCQIFIEQNIYAGKQTALV